MNPNGEFYRGEIPSNCYLVIVQIEMYLHLDYTISTSYSPISKADSHEKVTGFIFALYSSLLQQFYTLSQNSCSNLIASHEMDFPLLTYSYLSILLILFWLLHQLFK